MDRQKNWLVFLGTLVLILLFLLGWIGTELLGASRTTPKRQFLEARQLWALSSPTHYRMAAGYWSNVAQCYYNVEVLQDHIVHTYSFTCLGNSASNTLTVDGIFVTFERFATQPICSPNGCYCEGNYVVQATYDAVLGYPKSITTTFERSALTDLWHGKWRVQECLIRTNPIIEKFEILRVERLP